jgi:hypothetical protein
MFLIIIKNMDKFHQELFDVLTRSRNVSRTSKAASTTMTMAQWALQDSKTADVINQVVRKSMAASLSSSGVNAAHVINDFIFSRH